MKQQQNVGLLDGEGNPVPGYAWSPLRCEKSITFAGATTDAWGDDAGALDGGAIFVVTGTVRARILGICEVIIAGSGKLEVGVTADTAKIIAQTTGTDIDAGEIWHDASPDVFIEASTIAAENIIANGLDVILTVSTNNITSGRIKFHCSWYPVSLDGLVVPSNN